MILPTSLAIHAIKHIQTHGTAPQYIDSYSRRQLGKGKNVEELEYINNKTKYM